MQRISLIVVSLALHLVVFVDEISGEGRTRPEHEHRFVHPDIRRVFIEEGVPNSLLVTCVTIQFRERFLECRVLYQTGFLKGL